MIVYIGRNGGCISINAAARNHFVWNRIETYEEVEHIAVMYLISM